MTTEYNTEMEINNFNALETQTPFDYELDRITLDDFEIPNVDLIDFDLLFDGSSDAFNKMDQTEGGANKESDLDCENLMQRKNNQENNMSFLDLLDDIFKDDESMEMLNSPLDKIDELLHYRLADTPENNRVTEPMEDGVFKMPKTYTCFYCPEEFYSRILCHDHQVHHVKDLLKCEVCGKRTRSNSGMTRHMQYFHWYSPNMCHAFFDSA